MSYHKTNLGMYAGDVIADLDGYVHETIKAAKAGNWPAEYGPNGRLLRGISHDYAREVAAHNRQATKESLAALREWRRNN